MAEMENIKLQRADYVLNQDYKRGTKLIKEMKKKWKNNENLPFLKSRKEPRPRKKRRKKLAKENKRNEKEIKKNLNTGFSVKSWTRSKRIKPFFLVTLLLKRN